MRSTMTSDGRNRRWLAVVAALGFWACTVATPRARADGMVVAPRDYKGSLEERAQEAIILFHAGEDGRQATEDMILKIRVEGAAESFAWVIALPDTPTTAAEDSKLFEELHRYVQARKATTFKAAKGDVKSAAAPAAGAVEAPVEVISRKEVGSYDVAVVRENQQGALQGWLADNGYRKVEGAEELIDFYRKKGYVFACIRVRDASLQQGTPVDLHPLRFSFKTGGRDGVYFPMRLTGLQAEPFDVNLYVLYGKWLNDRLNGFGFAHRGFALNWRDFDSPECKPNAGKLWSDPVSDPYLKPYAGMVPTVTKLCQKLHPGERYYLTNLQATGLIPRDVRDWPEDLWLFPYYTDKATVPYDAREGGPASAAYPNLGAAVGEVTPRRSGSRRLSWLVIGLAIFIVAMTKLAIRSARHAKPSGEVEL
jgi:hypothetical protein